MPTYQFQCDKCGKTFTLVRPMSAHGAVACPQCKAKETRQLTSAFYAKTIKKS